MLASKIEKRLHCVKSVRVRSFSGPYFLAFGLNTEIYSARMGGGIRTRITPNTYVVYSPIFCHFTQQNLIY